MVKIMGMWPSEHGQITKFKLSYGRRTKFFPLAVGFAYDWLRIEGYLGNVGLKCLTFIHVR